MNKTLYFCTQSIYQIQINEIKNTKTMKQVDVRLTMTVFAKTVSDQVIEVDNVSGISLGEVSFWTKHFFKEYDNSQI